MRSNGNNVWLQISRIVQIALFTVRKAGDKMSFFLDKSYLYSTNYDNFANNYGFTIPKNGVISVQNIKIDYISPKPIENRRNYDCRSGVCADIKVFKSLKPLATNFINRWL
jgi:hypothetical protein